MIAKTFEVRDSMTFLPVLAIQLQPVTAFDRYLLARAGYGQDATEQKRYVLLGKLDGGQNEFKCDADEWNLGTMATAHAYITEHFDKLESGQVVDVEFISGKSNAPKRSEAFDD